MRREDREAFRRSGLRSTRVFRLLNGGDRQEAQRLSDDEWVELVRYPGPPDGNLFTTYESLAPQQRPEEEDS